MTILTFLISKVMQVKILVQKIRLAPGLGLNARGVRIKREKEGEVRVPGSPGLSTTSPLRKGPSSVTGFQDGAWGSQPDPGAWMGTGFGDQVVKAIEMSRDFRVTLSCIFGDRLTKFWWRLVGKKNEPIN